MNVEESWTLVGTCQDGVWRGRRLRYRSGAAASVVADGEWTLRREETRHDVVGFMHTHPMGGLAPSTRDLRTMRAWSDAFGKPLLCVIATPDAIGGWIFDGHRSRARAIHGIECIGRSQIVGVERHGQQVPSRATLPRRGPHQPAGGVARHAVRRGSSRVQPRG
jgi:hypothetical protein